MWPTPSSGSRVEFCFVLGFRPTPNFSRTVYSMYFISIPASCTLLRGLFCGGCCIDHITGNTLVWAVLNREPPPFPAENDNGGGWGGGRWVQPFARHQPFCHVEMSSILGVVRHEILIISSFSANNVILCRKNVTSPVRLVSTVLIVIIYVMLYCNISSVRG